MRFETAAAAGILRSRSLAGYLALVLAVLLTLLVPSLARAEPKGGPTQILITFRSEAADRPAFRTYLAGEHAARLDRLKAEGVLKDYQILFNPFVTTGTWDAMTILSFRDFAATKRWAEVERTMPSGLSAAGLKLAKPLQTYSADLEWEGQSADPGDPKGRVAYVIPYNYDALDQYKKYVDAYVIPQVKGWAAEGVLGRYSLYLNRYPVGEPWDALFVYEYRDHESFGRRAEVVEKVRGPLRNDPVWKQLNETKSKIRSETENTVAEILRP